MNARTQATKQELTEALRRCVEIMDCQEMLGAWEFLFEHGFKWEGPALDMNMIRDVLARASNNHH